MEVILGKGNILISQISDENNRRGIILQKVAEQRKIGEFVDDLDESYIPTADDIVIWVDSPQSGRILQDAVNLLILKLENMVT